MPRGDEKDDDKRARYRRERSTRSERRCDSDCNCARHRKTEHPLLSTAALIERHWLRAPRRRR